MDIAQSYGARENLAVLIVKFNFQKKTQHVTNPPHQQQQPRLPRQETYSENTNSSGNYTLDSEQRNMVYFR